MAGKSASEYDGTDAGNGSPPIDVLDPASLAGNGGGIDGGDGSPSGSTGPGDADRYVRDDAGNVILNTDGSPKRKRGRKPGGTGRATAGAKPAQAGAAVSVNGIEAILYSLHTIAAAATKTPEIALEKSEAKTLAEAVANVAKHYPQSILTDKQMAILNLGVCSATIYGPRIYMTRVRWEREKAQARQAARTATPPPTPEAAVAASFVPPGSPGFSGPVDSAGSM